MKYLRFQLTDGDSPNYYDVCVSDLNNLWPETNQKIVFIQNNFNNEGVLKFTLNQTDPDGLIINHLRSEIKELIEGSSKYRVILKTLPFSKTLGDTTTSYTGTLGIYKITLST